MTRNEIKPVGVRLESCLPVNTDLLCNELAQDKDSRLIHSPHHSEKRAKL